MLLELSPNAAVLQRLPATRWSQPCPCSLPCSVLLEAEAAAVAAGQRQLWLLLQPGAQEWPREGPALLPMQAHPQCHSVGTWVSDPIRQSQDCLAQNIWGLGLGNLPPWRKELLSMSAGQDCPKQCPSP